METSKRFTLSLPEAQIEKLAYVAAKLGISRSALVASMLEQSLPSVVQIVNCLPTGPIDDPEEATRRFRGDSARIIRASVKNLLGGAQGDIFKD